MFRGVVALIASVLAFGTAHADDGEPALNKKVAIWSKPSVVRVVAIYEVIYDYHGKEVKDYVGGTGSGFFVSADGFIATNAHVVQDIHDGESAARKKMLGHVAQSIEKKMGHDAVAGILAELRFVKAKATAEIVEPDGTKLPYTIRAYGAPIGDGEGKDVAIIKVDVKNAPNLIIGDSDQMQVQDRVIAIGYPGAADLQGLLDKNSQLEASITDGSVSAKKRTTDGDPVLQVSVPITHGNSGGPAINEKGEVIGLTTFGSRNEVQGFNFLVAASTVQQFVKQAHADNEPSRTNVLWRKALAEMWDGDYDAAIGHFDEVKSLFPTHSEVAHFMKDARQAKKDGKGKKPVVASKDDKKSGDKPATSAAGAPTTTADNNNAAAVAIAVTLGIAVLGIALFFIMRKKPAAAAAGAPGYVVAINAPPPPAGQQMPIAKTAFGSLTLGSLNCVRGQLIGQRFGLTPQGVLIGRQPGLAQIVLNDSRASGKHVWIGYENGILVAIDQGTTNGTYVNDVRYGRISKAPLKDGDVVIVSEPDCLSLQLKLS